MNAFLTGSHAYGRPTADSDIDIVMRVDEGLFDCLHEILCTFPDGESQYDCGTSCQIRFGKVDLICCFEDETFAKWLLGTRKLQKRRGQLRRAITRDEAVQVFKDLGI